MDKPNKGKLLWQLFSSMFYLSAFTFGGGYVIITLMKNKFVDKYHWLEETEMLDLTALVAGGHVLIEDVPGMGKTVLARSLAKSVDGAFGRIQFTPDLLPSDVTGLNFFDNKSGEFQFSPGPVFCNILLADEINRATPRTQAGLLECMEEEMGLLEDDSFQAAVTVRDGGGSQKIQNDQVEELIDAGCDVLCVNLVDRADPSEIIDLARENEVPIIFFNREPVAEDMLQWEKLYYVGADAKQSGVMQGELAADAVKENPQIDRNKDGKIQYVVLEGEPGHQDAIIRTENAVETLREQGVELEKLSYGIANWNRAQAENRMLQMIGQHQNQIELVLANNDAMALGALDAYKKLNRTAPASSSCPQEASPCRLMQKTSPAAKTFLFLILYLLLLTHCKEDLLILLCEKSISSDHRISSLPVLHFPKRMSQLPGHFLQALIPYVKLVRHHQALNSSCVQVIGRLC